MRIDLEESEKPTMGLSDTRRSCRREFYIYTCKEEARCHDHVTLTAASLTMESEEAGQNLQLP
jgi:hypothetical protein